VTELRIKAKKWNIAGIKCPSRKKAFTLNYQYLGADDAAGPNYTGQAAVNSHYDRLED
jgi:hypothetical protein